MSGASDNQRHAALAAAISDRGPLDHEILGEKAAALGRAGEQAEKSLRRLREAEAQGTADGEERARLQKAAARAVYAYFVQRELCGLRRHDEIVRRLAIPRAVLVRLGAV